MKRGVPVGILALALLAAGAATYAAFSSTTSNDSNSFAAASAFTGYRDTVMADNPVAYWRLGESSGTAAADQTANANNGTYTNGPTLAQSGAIMQDSDTAVSFDGSNDYVSVPHSSSLNLGDTLTLEAWIKRASASADGSIVEKNGSYGIWIEGSKLTLRLPGTGDVAESTRKITDTTSWHHVVATKSGSTVRLYLDGADVTGHVTNRTLVNTTNALTIGQSPNFNGLIDEPAVYGTALSESRVQAHYRSGHRYYAEVMSDSPAGYWRLGEGSGNGSVAFDGKGTSHGIYAFSPTLGAGGALLDSTNTAASFDGVDDAVTVPNSASLQTADTFTLEAWVKRGTSGAANQTVFDKQSGSYVLRLMSDDKVYLRKSGTGDIVASTTSITDTADWHHVVATKSGSTVKLYIDGQDVTGTVSNQTIANNTSALRIGSDGTTSFNGTIDEAAVYPTALSLSRIQAHYEAGRPYHEEVERDGPISYWRMAESGDTIAYRAASSTGLAAAATSITINKPAGVVQGDVMVAAIHESGGSGNTSITVPTGWVQIRTQTTASTKLWLYYKVAGAGEGASYTWSTMNSSYHTGGIIAFQNVDNTNPVDVSASQLNANSLSITCPSVTTTAADDRLLAFPFDLDDNTYTFPASMTERFDVKSAAAGNRSIAGGGETLGAAGASGTRTITNDNNGGGGAVANACASVALRPAFTMYDSRHSNDGSYVATGVTLGQPGPLAVDTDPAVTFTTGGQAAVPNSTSMNVGDGPLTLEAWVKRSSTTTEDDIAGKGTNAYKFSIKSNKLTFSKLNVSDIVASTTNIADTNWHHVAATKNGATVKLYIDGKDVTGTITNATLSDTTSSLVIGGIAGITGNVFDGSIDEFALYNKVLTPDQVAQHYAEGVG